MVLTIGQGIILFLLFVCALWLFYVLAYDFLDLDGKKRIMATVFASLILTILLALAFNWYNTSTATGIRNYKDFKSDLSNGMYRELVITAEDGREIFKYEGKFDIEINKDNDNRYLRFESEDGKRYTIMYGIQDTVIITEKDPPSKEQE